jgi:DNA polymerase elongation subunit (family B)
MSYIDALFDRDHDRIHVVGRRDGERYYQEYAANYVMYYDDPRGKFRSIHGNPVSRFSTRNSKEFRKEQRIQSGKNLYEADINPVFRCLEENYKGQDAPRLHTAFFDIEVDFDPERGFSRPDDPFNAVTAISIYLDWLDQLVTLVTPPRHMSRETAQEIAAEFPNCFVFEKESELLDMFLNIIQDADVLSGWNSEGYDIPYTVQRITRVLSRDDTRRFCLWDQLPRQRTFERYGAESITFDLVGRVHLDYMQLYRKYTYEERHSYSLDAILEYEGLEGKTKYEGTLDQLYNRDFRKFIEYNRQDTRGLSQIDRKLRFLDLANTLAHENTVLLPTTMGAVAVTEQAIINEAHERGMVVPVRRHKLTDEDTQAAGAYVAYPKKGMHDWIGSIDINSLYPSAIRALNMGPETIVGQLRPIMTDHLIQERMTKQKMSFAGAWEGLFATLEYTAVMEQQRGTEITVDWETGENTVMTGAEIWHMIFDSNRPWMLSANGTIFTYEREGVVPGLLKRWYAERKEMQAKLKNATTDEDEEYWDKRQLVKKINLNSLYGAILNPGCRFFDKRIGQSTTLTGRAIAQHMDAYVNECITGRYDHVGDAIIYGDSVTGDTKIKTSDGEYTIEEIFNQCQNHCVIEGKEYGGQYQNKVIGFNSFEDNPVMSSVSYVMRHHTKKKIYQIELEDGNTVKVTEDHSVMVDRDGFLIEVKPTDIRDTDLIICLKT